MTQHADVGSDDAAAIQQFVEQAMSVWTAMADDESTVRNVDSYTASLSGSSYLSLTLPGMPLREFVNWFGHRILYWANGIEHRRRISVVSSRLPQRKDLHQYWFDALRTVVSRCNATEECLVVVDSTASADALRRAAELFQVPQLRLSLADKLSQNAEQIAAWLLEKIRRNTGEAATTTTVAMSPAWVSPGRGLPGHTTAAADAGAIGAGQRVIALSCRSKGNIDSILRCRLKQSPSPTVLVLNHADAISNSTLQQLQESGAVPWLLEGYRTHESQSTTAKPPKVPASAKNSPSNCGGPLQCPEEWLCHWTRSRPGPWPNESPDEYLDALIMNCVSADHSAIASLRRIIESGTLLRSDLSRGTVSFTAVPLADFRERRTYRRHLRRYDFEPWGIAVRRSALQELGCRPVRYVDKKEADNNAIDNWNQHPSTDATGRIDWTQEQEWRVPFDVNLSTLIAKDVIVFVDTEAEAQSLRAATQWAVLTLPHVNHAQETGDSM